MDWHQYCIEPVSIFDEYVKFHYRSGSEHFQLIFMTGDTKPEPELRKFYLLEENSIFLIVCVEYMCVCSVVSYSLWPRGPILQKYFEFCQQISYKNLFSCYRNTCISSSWPLVLQSLKYLIPGLLQKKKLLISVVASQCLFKKSQLFLVWLSVPAVPFPFAPFAPVIPFSILHTCSNNTFMSSACSPCLDTVIFLHEFFYACLPS